MADDVNAESSPAAAVPAEPERLLAPPPIETWSDDQLSTWRLTGKIPQPSPAAESAAAEESSEPEPETAQAEETPPESGPDDKQVEPPPQKKGAELRKAQLNREITGLLKARNDLAAQVERLKTGVIPAEPPAAGAYVFNAQIRPHRAQYATDDDYIDAVADWRYQVRRIEETQAEAAKAEQAAAAALEKDWNSRRDAAKQRQKDWAEVVAAAQVPITPEIKETLMTDEYGPDLVYALAKDHDLARRIFAMSPMAAGRELGRMSAELAKKNNSAKPAVQTVTAASNPPRELNAQASSTLTPIEQSQRDKDFTRYHELRNKERLASRK
jgi:hypothetical protein